MSGSKGMEVGEVIRDREFFREAAADLAPKLLGMILVRTLDDGKRLAGEIVEVEAYLGVKDRASHTFGGRRTARNEAMYGRAGTVYVYFTYGMHHCVNIVCGVGTGVDGGGVGEAVLIRALKPLEGIDAMRLHRAARVRGSRRPLLDRDLCSGPGKVCQALSVDRAINGIDLLNAETLSLEAPSKRVPVRMSRAARVGVDSAGSWASRRLRWFVRGSDHVSVGPM